MKPAKTMGLAACLVVLTAPFALAGGGCQWGNHAEMTADASGALPQSVPAEETVVAQLSCDGLAGDALVTCLAGQNTTQ